MIEWKLKGTRRISRYLGYTQCHSAYRQHSGNGIRPISLRLSISPWYTRVLHRVCSITVAVLSSKFGQDLIFLCQNHSCCWSHCSKSPWDQSVAATWHYNCQFWPPFCTRHHNSKMISDHDACPLPVVNVVFFIFCFTILCHNTSLRQANNDDHYVYLRPASGSYGPFTRP